MAIQIPTEPRLPVPGAQRRLALRYAGIAVAATALIGIVTALFAAQAALPAARVADPAVALYKVPSIALHHPIAGESQRYIVNALLVPLLDTLNPRLWTDTALRSFCGPETRAEIDSQRPKQADGSC